MSSKKQDWRIFRGDSKPHDRIQELPPAPPWRQFKHPVNPKNLSQDALDYWAELQQVSSESSASRDEKRGQTFRLHSDRDSIIDAVNAALYLRRPLLVTGKPGTGKTSLAHAIAYELKLGPVLKWAITTRSTLEEGLYQYDALARLQSIQQNTAIQPGQGVKAPSHTSDDANEIGEFIRLGPLGTAFLPTPYPRVLLIDEIDKSDINLPNDLLNLLEEGEFPIPVLKRLARRIPHPVKVGTADSDLTVFIEGGKVLCQSFPLIVMTSNDERDFPPAFLRRCLQVKMPKPLEDDLKIIVQAHLGEEVTKEVADLIAEFVRRRDTDKINLATDQLLNAVFLRTCKVKETQALKDLIFAALSNTESGR